jgi:hypothetical protein
MRTELLLLLATRLEQITEAGDRVGPIGFDMRAWINFKDREHICGTTACAMGHAALMPEFQAEGLYFRDHTGRELFTAEEVNRSIVEEIETPKLVAGGRFITYLAIASLFEIHDCEARTIFGGNPRSPRQVAWQIRTLVEKGLDALESIYDYPSDDELRLGQA